MTKQSTATSRFLLLTAVALLAWWIFARALNGEREIVLDAFDDCEPGAASQSPGEPSLHKVFQDIALAEQYVCHEVAYPRRLGEWKLQGIDAIILRGVGPPGVLFSTWQVGLRYTLGQYATPGARYLVIFVSPPIKVLPNDSRIRPISIRGHPGQLVAERNSAEVRWNQDGLTFSAETQIDNEFPLTEFMAILRSVR
jgi:hypothetical protein